MKYVVNFRQTANFAVTLVADSAGEAKNKARKMLNDATEPFKSHGVRQPVYTHIATEAEDPEDPEVIKAKAARAELLNRLRSRVLLSELPSVIEVDFSGYGDSGNVYADTGDEELDKFMNHIVNTKVYYDWYNNDGGQGTVTWDLTNDRMTIDGSYNTTESHDEMCDVEV